MLFNSRIFIFAFFPIIFVLYYGLRKIRRHTAAKCVLLAGSLFFYAFGHVYYFFLLTGSIVFNYLVYLILEKNTRKGIRLTAASFAVIANLGVLFYFKYFDFFISNINKVFSSDIALLGVALPLGISFFTFQQVSFIVDTYKGETHGYGFLNYSLFVSFFPQLVAGPIVLHDELIPQFDDESRYLPKPERFNEGLKYFVIGLCKKTIVADGFSKIVDAGFVDNMTWSSPSALLIMTCYTIQLYFDFSGYSDMALGLGRMLGFDLPVNFDRPLCAENPKDFWKRWHITLNRFLTRYVYVPLGGSRKGKIRTYINIMIVFALSGIWHGSGWTFICWGVVCGMGTLLYTLFGKLYDCIPKVLRVLINFAYLVFSFTIFRAEYMSQALDMFKCLGHFDNTKDIFTLCNEFAACPTDISGFIVTMLSLAATLGIVFFAPSSHEMAKGKEKKYTFVFYAFMAALGILTFSNVTKFLYFNF